MTITPVEVRTEPAEFINLREAATAMGVSRRHVQALIDVGRLTVRPGPRGELLVEQLAVRFLLAVTATKTK